MVNNKPNQVSEFWIAGYEEHMKGVFLGCVSQGFHHGLHYFKVAVYLHPENRGKLCQNCTSHIFFNMLILFVQQNQPQ